VSEKTTTILETADGSHTLQSERYDESYHSKNGALNEAVHVFINAGLNYFCEHHKPAKIRILEVGFGTGLNSVLTRIHADTVAIHYITCEAFPVKPELISQLNYAQQLTISPEIFTSLHDCDWEVDVAISAQFTLHKMETRLEDLKLADNSIDIIYFDAFSPDTQPELWTVNIFTALHSLLSPYGILVTYSAKGDVKRALKQAGFKVKRLDGPVGKWHMVRAHKA
jgi:tRNA U34 5-methylaminomethyl-2-thiouridine-forming methyltransferase MnmC